MKRFVPAQARGDAPVEPLPLDEALLVVGRLCPMCKGEGVIEGRVCQGCAGSVLPGIVLVISPLELFLVATIRPEALQPEETAAG